MTVTAWLPSTATVVFFLLPFETGEATTCRSGDCTGLMITGGYPPKTDIEVFPAKATCTIPPFPSPGRCDHSLSVINDTLVACGGLDPKIWKSCISWRRGQDGWEDFHTLSQERYYHAAVVVDGEEDIIVLGGKSRGWKTGEIVKSGTQFSLQADGYGTCAASYQGGFVMIGGCCSHGKVDRYNSEGNYLDSLPDLLGARRRHACTTFTSSSGEEGLLVVGGESSDRSLLSSTELYLPSKNKWTRGGDLPRAMSGLSAVRLSDRAVVTGGRDGGNTSSEVLQYEETAGAWSEIGKMKKARSSHAVVAVDDVSLFCPGTTDANSNNDNGDSSSTTLTASWFALAVFFPLFR